MKQVRIVAVCSALSLGLGAESFAQPPAPPPVTAPPVQGAPTQTGNQDAQATAVRPAAGSGTQQQAPMTITTPDGTTTVYGGAAAPSGPGAAGEPGPAVGAQPSQGAAGAGRLRGPHAMSGDVVNKNGATGSVRLSTAEGSMTVQFPPQSLHNIKEGDTMTVYLALAKGTDASGGPPLQATGGRPLQGQHSLAGTVTLLDQAGGRLTVTTPKTVLELLVPPQALSDIGQDDAVTVHLAFFPGEVGAGGVAQRSGSGRAYGSIPGPRP